MSDASHTGQLLTQTQIARLAGVARTTVNFWRKSSDFPAAERAGETELFRQDAILSWLDDRVVPERTRDTWDQEGATYGDRARRELQLFKGSTDGVTEYPSTGTTPHPLRAEQASSDVHQVSTLMGEPVDRVRGAGSVIDYMSLLLCLLFLRRARGSHWDRLLERAREGSGSDGSRLLLLHIGHVTDELLKRQGMVPGMQQQLRWLEPRTYADLTDVVRRVGLLGPGAFRLVLEEYERRAELRSSEFFTPHSVARIMVSLAAKERAAGAGSTVFDPYARGGELLVAAAEHSGAWRPTEVHGYSHAHDTARLASMNLALLGLRSSVRLSHRRPWSQRREEGGRARFSLVLTNPPFNMNDSTREPREGEDWPYGAPPVGNDNLAYAQYVVGCLEDGGSAAVVMPNKAGDSANRAERLIRENLVERGVVRCVLELPDRLFSSTSIPVSVWFLGSPTHSPEGVLFLDARRLGVMRKGRRVLQGEDVDAVVDAYRTARLPWEAGQTPMGVQVDEIAVPGAVVSCEGIREKDYSLRPNDHLVSGRLYTPARDRPPTTRVWHTVEQLHQEVRDADVAAAVGIAAGFQRPAQSWKTTLADVCDIAAGPSFTRLRNERVGPEGDVPMVYPSHLRNGRLEHIDDRRVSRQLADRLRNFWVESGDILCIRTGAMGSPALVRPQQTGWLMSTNLLRLRIKKGAAVESAYLAAYLGRPEAVAWVRDRASATAAAAISKASLGAQPLVLPPYEEQVRIAGVLDVLEAQAAAHLRFATAVAQARTAMVGGLTILDRPR